MKALAEVFKIFNNPSAETENQQIQRLLQSAPYFKLGQVQNSLREFDIFFNLNGVHSDSLKFKILQGRIPWNTMHQFGVQNPDCGPNFKKLYTFY